VDQTPNKDPMRKKWKIANSIPGILLTTYKIKPRLQKQDEQDEKRLTV
jgi:hypothetical protein